MRHRLRQELEQDFREIVRGQRKQTETVKRGFAELGVQIRNPSRRDCLVNESCR